MKTVKSLVLAMALGLFVSQLAASQTATNKNVKQRSPRSRLSTNERKQAKQRLTEMGYGRLRPNGVIDAATRSALLLFEKWEGRKVTGRLNRDDYEAIMTASAPQPRDTGYKHVEVDLDRQLLLLTNDDGAITRILPVSTGSNKHYNEKGMRGLAYTPRGRFRIYAQVTGWKRSPLGLLYYPNYFSDGLAIHGYSSVPLSPKSHGCIRIPMSAAVEMSRSLHVGSILLIYDKDSFVSAKSWAEEDKQKQAAVVP